jgi:hypothetical protein
MLFCSPSGGVGIDTVEYPASSAGVTVNLTNTGTQNGGDAASDILSNFENVVGSAHNDTITGNANATARRRSAPMGSIGRCQSPQARSSRPTRATARRSIFPNSSRSPGTAGGKD